MNVLTCISLSVLCGVLVGCPTVPNPSLVGAVQIVAYDELPPGCAPLGPIDGVDSDRWTPGGPLRGKALRDLKEKAARGGGNHVIIDRETEPRETDYYPVYSIEGRLFSCPMAKPQGSAESRPAQAAAPPARVCEPECSPGYTCLRGACVSACNPLCASTERCGADRACHAMAPAPSTSAVAPEVPAAPSASTAATTPSAAPSSHPATPSSHPAAAPAQSATPSSRPAAAPAQSAAPLGRDLGPR